MTTAFGLTTLTPDEFSVESMKSVVFETEIELFTDAPAEAGPPFLSCKFTNRDVGSLAYGTIVVDLAMIREGHPLVFNFNSTPHLVA